MPTFEIEQYETRVVTYRVEAESEAAAIAKVFDGQAELSHDRPEHSEVAEDIGLPADDYPELVDELRAIGFRVDESVIPSIRSIREVESPHQGILA